MADRCLALPSREVRTGSRGRRHSGRKAVAGIVVPAVDELFAVFGDLYSLEPPKFEVVSPEKVPLPYHRLLVHEHHMTVTLERYHARAVELRVLAQSTKDHHYARMILLALQGSAEIVQFGIMRVNLRCLDQATQAEIVAARTPLGRILIERNVLRQIRPMAYLKVMPTQPFLTWFAMQDQQPIFGRLAAIFCNESPAVEVLEVVRPSRRKVQPVHEPPCATRSRPHIGESS